MGQNTRGIYPNKSNNTWEVDKWWRGERFRQRGFVSFEEADRWLIKQLAEAREVVLHGARKARIFDSVAAHYLMTNREKASLETEAFLLKSRRSTTPPWRRMSSRAKRKAVPTRPST